MRYKSSNGLVNSDIVDELTALLDEMLEFPYVQKYIGSHYVCHFCGAAETNFGLVEKHSSDCPVAKYRDLMTGSDNRIIQYAVW